MCKYDKNNVWIVLFVFEVYNIRKLNLKGGRGVDDKKDCFFYILMYDYVMCVYYEFIFCKRGS